MNSVLAEKCHRLYAEAVQLLKARESRLRHKVACVAWSDSAGMFKGINMKTSGMSHCAEITAIGSAIVSGVRDLSLLVSVFRTPKDEYRVILPCGNCRQLMADYFPGLDILLSISSTPAVVRLQELLPRPLLLQELFELVPPSH